MSEQKNVSGVEVENRAEKAEGREYGKPEVHDLGQLEQVQSNYHGNYYDGPRTTWLRY